MQRVLDKMGLLLFIILLSGCQMGDSSSTDDEESIIFNVEAPAVCTAETKKQYVWDVLNDSYLWSSEIPTEVNLDDYADEEELLYSLRDDSDPYSFILSAEEFEEWQNDTSIGFGLGMILNSDNDRYNVVFVYEDSPAWNAGIRRGNQITAVDDDSVSELISHYSSGDLIYEEVFGRVELGVTRQIAWLDTDDELQSAKLDNAVLDTNRVHGETLFETDQGLVGYFAYTSFTVASVEELPQTFEYLSQNQVNDLILDLRYNGGGDTDVSNQLASYMGGENTSDQVFISYQHNSLYSLWDSSDAFYNLENALNLEKVIILTNNYSASSSEMVINGLSPFVDVTLIGETTYGKPYGMHDHEYCDQVLLPIEFHTVNALGSGDFTDGFEPNCVVEDDPQYPYGDERDSQTAAALEYLETGDCTSAYSYSVKQGKSQPVWVYPQWNY